MLLRQQMVFLDSGIRVRREQGAEAAADMVQQQLGKQQMDRIREVAQLRVQFENDQEKQKIVLLEKDKKIAEERLNAQTRTTQLVAIAGLTGSALPTGSTQLATGPEPVQKQKTPEVISSAGSDVVIRSPGSDCIVLQSEIGVDRYWRSDSVLTV